MHSLVINYEHRLQSDSGSATRAGAFCQKGLSQYRQQFKGKQRDMEAWRHNPSGPIASLEDAEMLDHIHTMLDHAVLDAYGWPHNLSDEQILEHLLALNL